MSKTVADKANVTIND